MAAGREELLSLAVYGGYLKTLARSIMTAGQITLETMAPRYLEGAVELSKSNARLVALDRAAYGHARSALMQLLRDRAKFAAIRDEGEVQAFGAIRPFGRGLVVGPLVARNAAEAKALIDFLLGHYQGKCVRLDTYVSTDLAEWLAGRGLAHVGGGIAMGRFMATHKRKQARASPHTCAGQSDTRLIWRKKCLRTR